jgi:hypothetical protein
LTERMSMLEHALDLEESQNMLLDLLARSIPHVYIYAYVREAN